MKGREAARAAQRQLHESNNQVTRLKEELATLKKQSADEVAELRAQNRRLGESILDEAAKVAAREIARLTDERDEELARRVACEERSDDLAWRKDVLLYNTCRYLSMSLGLDVTTALGVISTWMRDREYDELVTESMLIEEGLPPDGWSCRLVRACKTKSKAFGQLLLRSGENSLFIELGKVEELRPNTVHPMYRPESYAMRPDAKKKKVTKHWARDQRGAKITKKVR